MHVENPTQGRMTVGRIVSPADALASRRARDREKEFKNFVPKVLAALDRSNLNLLHRLLAKWIVQCTLARGRHWMFATTLKFIAGPLPLSDSDVSGILSGRMRDGRHVKGLEEIGFVHRRECALDKGWLLTVLPDFSRWEISGLYAEASHERWIAEVDGLSADFGRRLSLREIDEWFPDIEAVLVDLNAENAVASLAGGHDAKASDRRPVAGVDALRAGETNAGGVGASSFSSARKPDALEARCAGSRRAVVGRGSEKPNPNCGENGGRFGKAEPSRARALSSGTKSSKSALTLSIEKLKDLIRSGSEADFVKAMQAMIPTHENGDGGKWRIKWRRPQLKSLVVTMFEGIIEKIAEGKLTRSVALEAHWYWQDFGGATAEKKLEDY